MLVKKTILVGLVLLLGLFSGLAVQEYSSRAASNKIASYYEIINSQEKTDDSVLVTEEDMNAILRCKNIGGSTRSKDDECLRDFYDDYTMKHGVEKAFMHLARLQREYEDLLANCHYISHGIGHAALRRSGEDVAQAFSILETSQIFKNIATCGNGYFHGVVEEVAKDITDNDALVRILGPVCADKVRRYKGGCFHGIGHATLIQTDYNIEDMLYVCDRISPSDVYVFSCLTGGFMEDAQSYPEAVEYKDGKILFTRCDSVPRKYQPSCYIEHAALLDIRARKDASYTDKIGLCKVIPDPLNRMACVKLFAIRAVRIVHHTEIKDMCNNTSTESEKIMCTAIVADRVASSVDRTRSTREFTDISQSICGALDGVGRDTCLELVREMTPLFYTTSADLSLTLAN